MEINPFITNIPLNKYLKYIKTEINNSKTINGNVYSQINKPFRVIFDGYDYMFIGYHVNTINNIIIGVLTPTHYNQLDYKLSFVNINDIYIKVEVVLKSELKDIKTVEQTELFKEDEQSKD